MRSYSLAMVFLTLSLSGLSCPQEAQVEQEAALAASSLARILGPALADECPAGGVELKFGIDSNQNGALDDAEVNGVYSVCHGEPGKDGEPCVSLPQEDGGFQIVCPNQDALKIGAGAQGEIGPVGPKGEPGDQGPQGERGAGSSG